MTRRICRPVTVTLKFCVTQPDLPLIRAVPEGFAPELGPIGGQSFWPGGAGPGGGTHGGGGGGATGGGGGGATGGGGGGGGGLIVLPDADPRAEPVVPRFENCVASDTWMVCAPLITGLASILGTPSTSTVKSMRQKDPGVGSTTLPATGVKRTFPNGSPAIGVTVKPIPGQELPSTTAPVAVGLTRKTPGSALTQAENSPCAPHDAISVMPGSLPGHGGPLPALQTVACTSGIVLVFAIVSDAGRPV